MRGYLVVTLFAGLLIVCGGAPILAAPPDRTDPQLAAPAVAVQRVSIFPIGVPEEAAMVLLGTALIGLAAAVRRAA